jgi:hypothetical protein
MRLFPSRPIINPVLRLYFGRPPVRLICDGKELPASDYLTQPVGDDLLVYIKRTIEEATSLEIIAT